MNIVHMTKGNFGGAALYAKALSDGLSRTGLKSVHLHEESISDRTLGSKRSSESKLLSEGNKFFNRLLGRFYVEIQHSIFHRTNRFREYDINGILSSCDLIHIHQATNWMGLSNLFADIPAMTPVVISLHDLWPITGGCVIYNGCEKYRESCSSCPILKRPFNTFLANRQLKLKKQVYDRKNLSFVANSEWTRQQMTGASVLRDDHEIRVIHPAVDNACFSPGDREAARAALDIDKDAFVVCTGSASITDANKNIPAVLRAVQRLSSDRPIIILIFGDGCLDVPAGLEVRFLGPIKDQTALAQIYQTSDIFVSTSRMETYGMTLIEAMACEIPVIAYRTGAIPSVIDDGYTGILVDLDDEQAISNSIETLLLDDDLRRRLGTAARQVVTKRNSLDTLVSHHQSLYDAALARVSETDGVI